MIGGENGCSSMTDESENVVCRCLQIREFQVVDCIAVSGAETVRQVSQLCGAGGGCRACHCRIQELIACRTGSRELAVARRPV